jgi:hypothetical protein
MGREVRTTPRGGPQGSDVGCQMAGREFHEFHDVIQCRFPVFRVMCDRISANWSLSWCATASGMRIT